MDPLELLRQQYHCYSLCSQYPSIRTLQGPKNMLELANVQTIESCRKNSSGPSEWRKNT